MRYLLAWACVLSLACAAWSQVPAGVPRIPLRPMPTVPVQPFVPPKPPPPGTPAQLAIFPNQQAYLASAFFFAGPVNPRFNDLYGLPRPMVQIAPDAAWPALVQGGIVYPPAPEEQVVWPPHFTDRAVVTLQVPRASADVWVGNEKLEDTGTTRYFISPVLDPDKPYGYDVRVRWYEDGKERTRTLRMNVKAGEQPVLMVFGALAKK